MARALARWDSVEGMANPAGWVYRVGLNWARSALRRRRESPSLFVDSAAAPAALADPSLHRALAVLPLKYRAVVVCRFLLDWSVDDTASALGVAPGTVKSRLNRALARLRAEMKEH